MNQMSKSTGTDVFSIRNQWIETARCQLDDAARFDCSICSVIASHVGLRKKISLGDVSLQRSESLLYECSFEIFPLEERTIPKKARYLLCVHDLLIYLCIFQMCI